MTELGGEKLVYEAKARRRRAGFENEGDEGNLWWNTVSGKPVFVIVKREPVRNTRRAVGLISFRRVVWCVFVRIGVGNGKNASEMKGAPQKRGKHESPDVGRGVGGLAFSEPFQASGRVVRACAVRVNFFPLQKLTSGGNKRRNHN